MDTLKIINYLKHLKIFQGVYPSDITPSIKSLPAGIVINTDNHKEPGEHWVALYIDEKKHGTYFDSYALPPLLPSILKTIKRFCNTYEYNKCPLQAFNSETCAHYCIFFIELKNIGLGLNFICNFFNKNRKNNDTMIRYLIKKFQ